MKTARGEMQSAIVSAAAGTVKGVLDVAKSILDVSNAVRRSAWDREELLTDLDGVIGHLGVWESHVQHHGLPSTPEGGNALKLLQKTLTEVKAELVQLRDGAAATPDRGQGWLKPCWGWCIKWCGAVKDAALAPRYKRQLQQLSARLEAAVAAAEKHGAFTYAQPLQQGLPELYIRHPGLFLDVTMKLRQQADDAARTPGMPGVRGVLITGSRGTGKSTLAKDVALALAEAPDNPFPDGIYDAYFGPQASDTDVSVIVATQQQLLLNRMKVDGDSSELKDVKVHLGNWLRGKRCLLLLDDVRSHQVVSAFNFAGFQGALLVTGLSQFETWRSAQATVCITQQHMDSPINGGPSLAERILASRAANDKTVVAVPEGCKDAAAEIIRSCNSNVLALVVMGCNIHPELKGAGSPAAMQKDWRDAAANMRHTLNTDLAEDYAAQVPVFGAIRLALSGLGDDTKAAFLALEPFRPGVLIPLPLVRRAVQEYTGKTFDDDAQLRRTTLLPAERHGLLEFVQQHSCYRLLDLQAMFMDVFDNYPNNSKPSSCLFQTSAASSTDNTPRQLLAAFLMFYGKKEVMRHARRFLELELDWEYLQAAALVVAPELSSRFKLTKQLAAGSASGALGPMSVVVAMLISKVQGMDRTSRKSEALSILRLAQELGGYDNDSTSRYMSNLYQQGLLDEAL